LANPLILEGRARPYYDEVFATLGKDRVDEFVRFIMVPGHDHCWEQPGRMADDFNPLVVFDTWVESGQVPDHVIALEFIAYGPQSALDPAYT